MQTPTDRPALTLHAVGAGVCALLLLAGWFLGVVPLMSESREQGSAVERAVQAERDVQHSKAKLEALNAELERVHEWLQHQPITLEPSSRINPLLAELAAWSDLHALEITKTQAARPVALAYYDYVPITLAGEGAFADLLGLLHRLHEQRGDLGVISFNLQRLPADGRVGFALELAWYVLGGPSGATTASANPSHAGAP